jgi:hypothetical protein
VYGDDTIASGNRYGYPFLTINAAMNLAATGELVYLQAGTYNETVNIKTGVSLRGSDAKSVSIQKLNVVNDTTLITMDDNTRLDNLNATLSSTGAYQLIGIDVSSGASVNAKIRNFTLNVNNTSASATGITAIGVRSSGVSSAAFNSSDLIARTTINTNTPNSNTAYNRALIVGGPNRVGVRDSVFYANGSSSANNVIGCETNDVSGSLYLKTSSVNGKLYDIKKTTGILQLSFTDLINANADASGFTVNTEPAHNYFVLTGQSAGPNKGDIPAGTYYLIPGSSTSDFTPNVPTGIPFAQRLIVFEGILSYSGPGSGGPTGATGSVPAGNTIKADMLIAPLPNEVGTQFASLTLYSGATAPVRFQSTSQTFNGLTDFLQIRLTITGNKLEASGTSTTNYNPPQIFCGVALY